MASLSEKLADVTLSINKFRLHLNSQGNVIDEKLARQNFKYSGKKCAIYEIEIIYMENLLQ